MAAILVSFSVQDEVTTTSRSGDQVTGRTVYAEKGLQMHLVLTPDGDPECQKLGFVQVRIECKPDSLPDMTREQTRAWMCEQLKKML